MASRAARNRSAPSIHPTNAIPPSDQRDFGSGLATASWGTDTLQLPPGTHREGDPGAGQRHLDARHGIPSALVESGASRTPPTHSCPISTAAFSVGQPRRASSMRLRHLTSATAITSSTSRNRMRPSTCRTTGRSRNLTLNLGLRWEYFGQAVNLLHDETVKREANPATAFWDTSLPLAAAHLPGVQQKLQELPAPRRLRLQPQELASPARGARRLCHQLRPGVLQHVPELGHGRACREPGNHRCTAADPCIPATGSTGAEVRAQICPRFRAASIPIRVTRRLVCSGLPQSLRGKLHARHGVGLEQQRRVRSSLCRQPHRRALPEPQCQPTHASRLHRRIPT